MAQLDELAAQLDRLIAFDSGPFPVISLYLNLQPGDTGRDRFGPFLRKELDERVRTYAPSGPEHESLMKDADKIRNVTTHLEGSSNGLALFACSAADLFETVQLAAPINEHRLYISDEPHLYPLARILDEYPQYIALLADTNSARILVFAANTIEKTDSIQGVKTKRHKMGGWSQARYQRHVENYHVHHAKEVVDAVARIARDDSIDKIVVSGDPNIVPLLREQMPKDIAERVIDMVRLDTKAPEHEVLAATIEALREKDARTDRERVDVLLTAYRGNGLACAGVEATLKAFELGQVEELVITAAPETIDAGKTGGAQQPGAPSPSERAADALIAQARNTAARIRFIEDSSLLASIGGVGAFLRFKL